MEEISILPGRIRVRERTLFYNKPLARYINVYIDNLYGVKSSTVSPYTGSILVNYDPAKINDGLIRKNITNAITSVWQNKPEKIREYNEYDQALAQRAKAKRNLFIFGVIYLRLKIKNRIYGKSPFSTNVKALQAASVVTIIGGYPILKIFYKKLFKKIPADSDILLSLTALSFTLTRESAKGVLLLALKALNDYIKYSADAEGLRLLQQSMDKTAEMAWLVSSGNQEILVGLDTLKIGDPIIVHEGEVIPVEGKVIKGSALTNTLYYSGQPVLAQMSKGSRVQAGLSVLSGNLTVKVEQLPKMPDHALIKPENTRLHRRVSNYQQSITPLALGAAAVSYLFSGRIMNALAVLLALTPSGAGTALSTGLKSYVALLNKHKIYLRRPETLDQVIQTDHMVFDKTGTLTDGRMSLELVASFDSAYSEQELLAICTACESPHYHPIALTLQDKSKTLPALCQVHDSILIPSKGVRASYENHTVLIGNKEFMTENGVDISAGLEVYRDCAAKLLIPVLVSIDHRLSGIIAFADTLKTGSYDLIRRLKQDHSLDVSLVTGDNASKARNIAQRLGIAHVFSNCSSADKARIIRDLKTSQTVLMVGDGINDMEAMREADISVSFADSSCDTVKLHSDFIIWEEHMPRLADLVSLSQKSYRAIDQSITMSQLLNLLFGGLAFVGGIDAFTAKSLNTVNSLLVLLLNKRIEYFRPESVYKK